MGSISKTPATKNTTGNCHSIAGDRRSNQTKVPIVYFDLVTFPEIPSEKPRIKIGESGDHEKRRKQNEKPKLGIEFNVDHLCVIRGTRADEQQLLRYFKKHRLENDEETFWPHEELVDYIRWLRDQWFVWVPDDDQSPSIEDLDCVDASLWMPNSERMTPPPIQKGLFSEYGILNLPPRQLTIDDFFTNEVIIRAARRTLGWIDLDPASHAVANRVIKATRFYTASNSALTRKWEGRVWLNPPFSQWEQWVPKIVNEWQSGRIQAMCILCATRTLTAKYFHPIHASCTGLCILYGRIPFWGGRAATPDDGHAVFYFGNDIARFNQEFSDIGSIYTKAQSL